MDNSAVYSGIKSFVRFGDTNILVQDKSSKASMVEDYDCVKEILKILLTDKQFTYFESHILSNETVYIDFNRMKILKLNPKNIQDEISRQLSISYITDIANNDEEEFKSHLGII